MQSTGQASTQAVSLVPMQGSAMTKAICHLPLSESTLCLPERRFKQRGGKLLAYGADHGKDFLPSTLSAMAFTPHLNELLALRTVRMSGLDGRVYIRPCDLNDAVQYALGFQMCCRPNGGAVAFCQLRTVRHCAFSPKLTPCTHRLARMGNELCGPHRCA